MSVRQPGQGYPVPGPKGDTGQTGATGATGQTGATGPQGPADVTLMGNVALTQTAAIAIALGIREVTVALSGVTVGAKYIAFCVSYRLNGGAVTPGRPTGYAVLDATCNTAGQITVSLNAPLLAIGQSYVMNCDIVRVNV